MNYTGGIQFLLLYGVEIFIAVVFSAFSNMPVKKKKHYLFFSLGILAVMTMFRDFSIGNDTGNYVIFFNTVDLGHINSVFGFEKGYAVYNYVLKMINNNPRILLIVTGLIIYTSIFHWINKWCMAPGLPVCLLVGVLQFDFLISGMRQALAIAILLWSYDFLIKRKFLLFFATVLLAYEFHRTAIVFFIVYPLMYMQTKKMRKGYNFEIAVFASSFLIVIMFDEVFNLLVTIFPKYAHFIGTSYADGQLRLAAVLMIFVYLLMLIFPILVCKKKRPPDFETEYSNFAMYQISIINLAFLIIATKASVLGRISYYFVMGALQNYAESVSTVKKSSNRIIINILSVLLFGCYGLVITIMRTPEWQTTYPFKFM